MMSSSLEYCTSNLSHFTISACYLASFVSCLVYPVAETWRRFWGGTKFFCGPKFLNDVFFGKKLPFYTRFLVIDQVFLILRIFTVSNVVYDPFFTRKSTISEKNSLTPIFYSVRAFAPIPQH